MKLTDREKAKRLYLQGKTLAEISAELDIKSSTLRSWKSRDKWPDIATKKRNKKVQRVAPEKEIHNSSKPEIKEYDGLNFQQQLFCEVYVHNFNATMAYIKVYGGNYDSANSLGSRLLANVSVRAYIDYLKELKAQSLMMGEANIVERYMQIAFADYTDYIEFGETLKPVISGGAVVKDINPATGDLEPIMQRVNFVRLKDSNIVDGGLIDVVHIGKDGAVVKLSDRMKALEWLGKYFVTNPLDKHKIDYDKAKQELDKQAFEHRKKQDEINNF